MPSELRPLPRRSAKPPVSDRINRLDGRMEIRDWGESLLNQPIDLDLGPRGSKVGQGRKGMDHVAEGRQLYNQDTHGLMYAGSVLPTPLLILPERCIHRGTDQVS